MSLTKIGSIGINTGIQFAGVTTVSTLHVGSGVTLSSDGDVFATGISTFNKDIKVGSGITLSPDGDVFATGISTFSEDIKVGSGITLSPDGDGFYTGVVTATSYYGDGSNLSNVTSTTINSNADNRLITGSGTANTLNGESNLTFDGTNTLAITGPEGGAARIDLICDEGDDAADKIRLANTSGNLFKIQRTTSHTDSLVIDGSGNVGLSQGTPSALLHLQDLSANGYELKLSGNTISFNRTSLSYIDQLNDSGSLVFRMTSSNTEALRIANNSLITATQPNSAIGLIVKNSAHDSQLQILATAANKNSAIFFGDDSDDDIGQIDYDHNDNSLSFTVNASKYHTLTSDGYTGLNGINNPGSYDGWGRHLVLGSTTGHGGLTIVSGNDDGEYGHILFADGTGGTPDQEGRIGYEHDSNFMYFATNNSERLRLLSDGKVVIGQTTSDAKFHVHTSSHYVLTDSGVATNHIHTTAVNGNAGEYGGAISFGMGSQGAAAVAGVQGGADADNVGLSFVTHNSGTGSADASEMMRLNSSGRLDIGDSLGTAHCGKFQVIHEGGGQLANDFLAYFETNSNDWLIGMNSNEGGSAAHYQMYFMEEGTVRGSIGGSHGSNVTYNQGSDYRWKENIVDMTGTEGIDICKKLKPRKYNWIKNREGTGQINTVDGFIAHEVVEAGVLGAVTGEKDAVKEDGSIDGQTLDYGQMTPVLAAAIKGLIDKVETLESKVTALEGS